MNNNRFMVLALAVMGIVVATQFSRSVQGDACGNGILKAHLAPEVADAINPAGMVAAFANTSAPSGWLVCAGQTVSRPIAQGGTEDTYSDLYTAIGTTYGPGDGTTTFNLPNMAGRVAVGVGNAHTKTWALADKYGEDEHLLTSSESGIPAHNHIITCQGYENLSGNVTYGGGGAFLTYSTDDNTAEDATLAHNNIQPSLALNYYIKY